MFVTRKNPDWMKSVQQALKKNCKEIAVGYPKGNKNVTQINSTYAAQGHDVSILQVAVWNNFGTKTIPRRPFMDQAEPKLQVMWHQLLKATAKKINTNPAVLDTVMQAAANRAEGIVRNEIDNGGFVPNAPYTVRKKGSAQPLIDKGDLRKYVAAVIRPRTK